MPALSHHFFQVESNKTKYPPESDFALPTTETKILPLMKANPSIYNVTILSNSYYRYFEVALGFFIFDGRSPGYANTYDFEVYSKLAGGSLDEGIAGDQNNILQGETLCANVGLHFVIRRTYFQSRFERCIWIVKLAMQ